MLLKGKLNAFKFVVYTIGQLAGAFLASILVYLVYLNELKEQPDGMFTLNNAGIFATYPTMPNDSEHVFGNFCDQFFATFLFILTILAITDKKNYDIPNPLVAILIGLSLLVVGASFGHNCGFAVNPARDLAPRLFTLIAGWGSTPFTAANYYFWVPLVAPMLGSVFATLVYSLVISNNWPDY
jgi:MIP family channel proteins